MRFSLARQPGELGIFFPNSGLSFSIQGEYAQEPLAALVAVLVAPKATLEHLNDPEQAVRLAADHLASRSNLAANEVIRRFDQIVSQACGGSLPRGVALLSLFGNGPLSWPRKVFNCNAIQNPLAFFDGEELSTLPGRLAISAALADPRTPLYHRQELGSLLADFVTHQHSHQEALLRDGHAATAFARSPWLDVWLNKLYPIKIPVDFADSPYASPRHGYDARYVEFRRLALPLTQQSEARQVSRESALLERQILQPFPAARYVWGRWLGQSYLECPYGEADLVTDLHEEDAEWLTPMRPVIDQIKTRTILELIGALQAGNATQLWDRVVGIIGERLNLEQFERLLRIDRKYLGYHVLSGILNPHLVPCPPGGLSTILELVGFVEKELQIGTMGRVREALGNLVIVDLLQRPKLVAGGKQNAYFVLAASSDRAEQWRTALAIYAQAEAQEMAFWANFRNRLQATLTSEIPQTVTVLVKPKLRDRIQPLAENQVRQIGREIEVGSLSPSALLPHSQDRPVKRFPLLDGLRWQEVTITFISNDSVEVRARDKREVFMFSELGCTDRRKGDRPDKIWETLHALAKLLSKPGITSPNLTASAKGRIKTLRKRLCKVMSIDDDPFESYRRNRMYKPKFSLIDAAYTQDEHQAENDD